MLDVQRNRGARYLQEIEFTRKLLWVHMIFGALVITLFLFHELFGWFAGAMLWYSVTLALMHGFMGQRAYCRWLLALVFLAGTLAGLYFINRVFPGSTPPKVSLVPHSFIPLWMGLSNLTYGIGALLLLFNSRIRRAGQVGFTLW